jgi:hypothetical protein
MDTIKERYKALKLRIRENEAQAKILEGELAALQHLCDHPHGKESSRTDYLGDTDYYFTCPDCGYHKRK